MNEYIWYEVCQENALQEEDVLGFRHDDQLYAVYHIKSGFYGTDGLCSHEQALLTEGYVSGTFVECPKHNARFDIPTGKAIRRPACDGIKTYPVKCENSKIYIGLKK